MRLLHFLFDCAVIVFACWYVRRRLIQEVEDWRQRKHAEIEMERIALHTMAELDRIQWERQPPCTTHDGAVITEWKQIR